MGAAPSIQQGGAQASKPWARPQTPPRTDWLGLPELPGVCFCADGRDGKGFAIRQDHTGAPAAFPGAKAFTTPAAVPSLDLAHVMQGSASGGRATTLSLDAQDKLTNLHVLPRPAADSLPPQARHPAWSLDSSVVGHDLSQRRVSSIATGASRSMQPLRAVRQGSLSEKTCVESRAENAKAKMQRAASLKEIDSIKKRISLLQAKFHQTDNLKEFNKKMQIGEEMKRLQQKERECQVFLQEIDAQATEARKVLHQASIARFIPEQTSSFMRKNRPPSPNRVSFDKCAASRASCSETRDLLGARSFTE